MKNFLFVALLFLFVSFNYSQEKFISTKGKEFIDPDGNPVLLKGTNLGNWLVPEGYMFKFEYASSPRLVNEVITQLVGPAEAREFWKKFRDNYITKDDIQYLKKLGFNSVRVPFNFRLFAIEEHPDISLNIGIEMLDRVIEWCKEENLYVLLDMHCAPGGQTGDNIDDSFGYPYLFENEESRLLTINIWKRIAEKYKDETILIGYDLLNEPIAHYFDASKLNPLLEPFYKELVAELRAIDKNHLMFLGGAQWDSNFEVFGQPFDPKLVYTFHKYWTQPTQDVIQSYLDYSEKYNVPLYMGESGENTNEWIDSFRKMLEENNVSWCFWPYKKMDSTRGIASIKVTDEYQKIIEFANGDRASYEKIRNSRPDIEISRKALTDFLENCTLKNCTINNDYLSALGIEVE